MQTLEAFIEATRVPKERAKVQSILAFRNFSSYHSDVDVFLRSLKDMGEQGGVDILFSGGIPSTFADLWAAYEQSAAAIVQNCGTLAQLNAIFAITHGAIEQALINGVESVWSERRRLFADVWTFRVAIASSLLSSYLEDWKIEPALTMTEDLLAPWSIRLLEIRNPDIWHRLLLTAEALATTGRIETARSIISRVSPLLRLSEYRYRAKWLASAEAVICGTKKRKPKGTSLDGINNLLAIGLLTDDQAARSRERVNARDERYAAEEQRRISEETLRKLASAAAGIPLLEDDFLSSDEQRSFFQQFCTAVDQGNLQPLHGNDHYLRLYLDERLPTLRERPLPELRSFFSRLLEAYSSESIVHDLRRTFFRILFAEGRYAEIVRAWPDSESRWPEFGAEFTINACLAGQIEIPGRVLMVFASKPWDSFSREFPELFESKADLVLSEMPSWRQRIADMTTAPPSEVEILSIGSTQVSQGRAIALFDLQKILQSLRQDIDVVAREAMNRVREHLGVPRVGEGWVTETLVYRRFCEAFPVLKVEQHGRPDWLAPQHLDVWIPELRAAIEFHGPQHFEAIRFFGGEEALRTTRSRDLLKAQKCQSAGVELFVIRSLLELDDVIEAVRRRARLMRPEFAP